MKMKKFLPLLLAGVMFLSFDMTASASTLKWDEATDDEIDNVYYAYRAICNGNISAFDSLTEFEVELFAEHYIKFDYESYGIPRPEGAMKWYDMFFKKPVDSEGQSEGEEEYDYGSEAAALEAKASGIPMATSVQALEENKTVGEYMNNAVVAAPGLDNAVPVAQGGNVIINGEQSNQTFSVLPLLPKQTDLAKAQAASVGGTVLNVVKIDASVFFDTATVNFYMPGIKTGQNIQVYQYDTASEQWSGVAVAEVRDDHVVVDMTSLGMLAFIEVPAAK